MEEKSQETPIKKDLILREKLALQRTTLANQTTFLAFLRSAMYFLIAGFSVVKLTESPTGQVFEYVFFAVSGMLILVGTVNYFVHKNKIKQGGIHVGDYKLEYESGRR